MPATTITSRSNPFVKMVRLVASRSRRAPSDLILIEGIRTLKEAVTSGHKIEGALLPFGFGAGKNERAVLKLLRARNTRLYHAADRFVKSLSELVSPQGVIGLARVPPLTLSAIRLPANPLVLCACGIQDPGNLGTLIRTAAAAGACLVCTIRGTVSARNSKCVRSSAGMIFRIPIVEDLSPAEFLGFCQTHDVRAYRAEARSGAVYWDIDFTQPTAILLGSEGQGLDESVWSGLTGTQIPMSTRIESLNVGSAGAILLFEACRQRKHARVVE